MNPDSYIKRLHDSRNRAHEAARGIVERARAEHRPLEAEEQRSYDRANEEIAQLDAQITDWRTEAMQRAEADNARRGLDHIVRPSVGDATGLPEDTLKRFYEDGWKTRASGAHEVDFGEFRLSAPGGIPQVEARGLGGYVGAGTLGGAVPTNVAHQLYMALADTGAIWKLSPTVYTSTNGQPIVWPQVASYGTATATAEFGSIIQSDPTLSKTTTTPHKFGVLTLVSNEFLTDANVDVPGMVAQSAGEAMAKTYGTALCQGAGGAGTITGYMAGGSIVKQGAGTITPAGVIDLQSKINQRYRAANAMFATNDPVLAYLRAYRAEGTLGVGGPWLVQQPSAPGLPETIFGAPVVIDNNILPSGSAVREMAYGSFERGYMVHNAGLRFEVSFDRYFEVDQVAYRLIMRLDGEVQDAGAYGIYQRTS